MKAQIERAVKSDDLAEAHTERMKQEEAQQAKHDAGFMQRNEKKMAAKNISEK